MLKIIIGCQCDDVSRQALVEVEAVQLASRSSDAAGLILPTNFGRKAAQHGQDLFTKEACLNAAKSVGVGGVCVCCGGGWG